MVRYLALLWLVVLVGCQVAPERSPSPAPAVKAAQPADEMPRRLYDTGVTTMAVDVRAGLPQRLTVPANLQPYPMLKGDTAFARVNPWLQLRLDAAQTGPLARVKENTLSLATLQTGAVAGFAPPVPFCATAAVAMPMDAGPRQNWVVRQVRALGDVIWQRWFEDDVVTKPAHFVDPLAAYDATVFTLEHVQVRLKGRVSDGGLVISNMLVTTKGEPVVHQLYLERRDCQRAWPEHFDVHAYWQGRGGSKQAGYHFISHRAGDGRFRQATGGLQPAKVVVSDEEKLRRYQHDLQADTPQPVWQQMGLLAPEGGAKGFSSHFSGVRRAALSEDVVLVMHIAMPVDTRYTTVALVVRLRPGVDGSVAFTRL